MWGLDVHRGTVGTTLHIPTPEKTYATLGCQVDVPVEEEISDHLRHMLHEKQNAYSSKSAGLEGSQIDVGAEHSKPLPVNLPRNQDLFEIPAWSEPERC